MRTGFLKIWDGLSSSFWFVPMVMAFGAMAASFATVALDKSATDDWLKTVEWAYTGSAEGATSVLVTIAGSMITIVGVVFSMTLVALSLASSQLGPRVLRSFMSDRANQVALGTFIATFLYALLVLRTIRRAEDGLFVPHLSVALAVLFSVAGLGVLVYFIHHVAVSIHADNVVARVGAELIERIDRLYPEGIGATDASTSGMPLGFDQEARAIAARRDGYIQLIDGEALMELAVEANLVLRVEHRPGHFVVAGSVLVTAWPGARAHVTLDAAINDAFVVGTQRTPVQDVEFAVDQLVEIAVRALSPGVNDPFTALSCIDRLGAALSRLLTREMPAPWRHDHESTLRVIAPVGSFSDVADAAFNQVRQYARSSAAVTIRLLDTIAMLAHFAHRAEDRAALRRHVHIIFRGSREGLPEAEDRAIVEARFVVAARLLDDGGVV